MAVAAQQAVETEADGLSQQDAERGLRLLRCAVGFGATTDRRLSVKRNRSYCRNGTRDARIWARLAQQGFACRFATIVPEIDLWCVTEEGGRLIDLSEQQIERLGRLIPSQTVKQCG
jgi:hypothetical protein